MFISSKVFSKRKLNHLYIDFFLFRRGGIKTGATGAIAPVGFNKLYNFQHKKKF